MTEVFISKEEARIQKQRVRQKKWRDANPDYYKKNYEANKEHKQKWNKLWREANPDKIYKANKNWGEANKEKKRTYVRTYHLSRPGLQLFWNAKHRAAKRRAIPIWYKSEAHLIKQVYVKSLHYQLHVDHIIPLQSDTVCGLHTWYNLQLLESSINITKGNRYQTDW